MRISHGVMYVARRAPSIRMVLRHVVEGITSVCVGAVIVGMSYQVVRAETDQAQSSSHQSRSALSAMLEKVSAFTLPNGVRVLMYRRGEAPVFAGAVIVRVGGSDEQPGITGVSHLFEHMAFKGTTEIGTKNYARERVLLEELEEIALRTNGATGPFSEPDRQRWQEIQAELQTIWVPEEFTRVVEGRGANGLNATTDKELTRYFVSLPRPALELWAFLESERILNPVMRQFYQERDVVLEERRMRFDDDPTGKLYESLLATAFTVHPYRSPVIGYQRDISTLTARQTDEFRRRYYVGQNIVVALVGDVHPERDRGLVEKYFGRIPRGELPPRLTVVEPPQQSERLVRVEHPGSPEVMIAYHKPNYPHPDDPAISILSEILAGSRVSPLYTSLVQREQIAVSVDTEEGPGFAYPNLLIFHGALRQPHTTDEFMKSFDRALDDFVQRGPTQEQLDIAKRAVAMAYLSRMGTSMAIALDLASSEILYGDWKAGVLWYDQAMAVTREDVHRVAKQYIARSSRTIAKLVDTRRRE